MEAAVLFLSVHSAASNEDCEAEHQQGEVGAFGFQVAFVQGKGSVQKRYHDAAPAYHGHNGYHCAVK